MSEQLLEDVAKAIFEAGGFIKWDRASDGSKRISRVEARVALAVAIEACAKVAEDAYKRGHLKQDIDSEIEPDAIAAAIRALKPKD